MKYETIIIGGGLAGLTVGITLAKHGRKVAIVSAGQSALHFCSGSFELLGNIDGKLVENPMEAMQQLPQSHPYQRIGIERTLSLLDGVKPLMQTAGLEMHGDYRHNHYRLTPLGYFKPAWLTLDDYVQVENPNQLPWRDVSIVNLAGYIDFYPQYIAAGLRKKGVDSTIYDVNLPRLAKLRKSSTEMRATNIARVMTNELIDELAVELNHKNIGKDAVLMPAVIGLQSEEPVRRLREQVNCPVHFIPTMPASVPGVRSQIRLREFFERLGGTYLLGDTIVRTDITDGILHKVYSTNLADTPLEADVFVLATGSFFSQGLIATPERVYEPIMDLDINIEPGGRTSWYDKDFYKSQPYQSFGIITDEQFRPFRVGEIIKNLYVAGSALGGCNAQRDGSGAGITLATALHVADQILNLNQR